MRKILLGTSALVAAGFLAAPAEAQLNVTISGYYRFDAAYVDEDGDGNDFRVGTTTTTVTTRDYDFSSRVRLVFDAAGTADNGLRYGARIRFHNGFQTNNTIGVYDLAYGFVQGSFGRVAFGDIESAGTQLRVFAPDSAGTGLVTGGTWGNFVRGITNGVQARTNTAGSRATVGFTLPGTIAPSNGFNDDVFLGGAAGNAYSTKLVYTTTGINLAGVTLGFSYAPEIGNRGRNYDRNAVAFNSYEDSISVGVQYANSDLGGGLGLKAAGQYNHANSRNANVEDYQTWMIGAQITYAGFAFGGHYIDNGDSGSATTNALPTGAAAGAGAANALAGAGVRHDSFVNWGLGLQYSIGPWTIGGQYNTYYVEDIRLNNIPTAANSPISDYEVQAFGVGASYVVAPGLTVGADVVHYEEDIDVRDPQVPSIRDYSGTVVAVRTQVTF